MPTELDDTAPAWCVRLISELDAADERATALARPLTPDGLNWKPRPGEWSIGQCLEHLCIANAVYGGAIAKSLDGRPPGLAREITSGWLGQWFIRSYIEPSLETRRRRAPRKIAPASHVDESVLGQFLMSNDQVRELVRRAGHFDVNRLRFRNPFVPVVYFTVGTGLEIISRHQCRHLLQAERMRTLSGFSGTGAETAGSDPGHGASATSTPLSCLHGPLLAADAPGS